MSDVLVLCRHCDAPMLVASRNFKSCADCKKNLASKRDARYRSTEARKESHARYEEKRSAALHEAKAAKVRAKLTKKFVRTLPDGFDSMSLELQDLILAQAKDDRFGHRFNGDGKTISLDGWLARE